MFWKNGTLTCTEVPQTGWDPKKVFVVFTCGTQLMGATYQQENTKGVAGASFRAGFGVDEMSIWLWLKSPKLDALMVPLYQ